MGLKVDMGKRQKLSTQTLTKTFDNDPMSAQDIAAECEHRAQLLRLKAKQLEQTAKTIRGILALLTLGSAD